MLKGKGFDVQEIHLVAFDKKKYGQIKKVPEHIPEHFSGRAGQSLTWKISVQARPDHRAKK
jgi:hypothetical protein